MGRFEGKAVIVTGASTGIGRATAQLFARKGAMVTICGRRKAALEETKRLLLAENGNDEGKILIVIGDICNEEVMKQIVDETVGKFHRLNVLVNNAGGTHGEKFVSELEIDLAAFDYTWKLNTRSVLRLCQLAYPHLIESQGEIVNVSSIAGMHNGVAPFPFYSISKAAQDQLTRNIAVHYIKKGVRVNSVSPGLISTDVMQNQGLSDKAVRAARERIVADPSRVPYQRAGTPEEVAKAILFLADRTKSNYIVGHQLVIDGGSSLQMSLLSDGFNMFAEEAAKEALHG
ncbi:unnamed protein product [Cylicocyclus nassatus]|uniref:Uncharacterized protein n=1 Tax=Cylicocyclus nassatus TaxID=53992 RepID=A0AA36MCL9_CYLNA|nr:unnamed protein product [Cylicocyclus nassatus]